MAVVINEFEVVSEPQAPTEPAAPPPGESGAAGPPSAHELERVVRRQIERSARVRAS